MQFSDVQFCSKTTFNYNSKKRNAGHSDGIGDAAALGQPYW
jgi:hypothetical protein